MPLDKDLVSPLPHPRPRSLSAAPVIQQAPQGSSTIDPLIGGYESDVETDDGDEDGQSLTKFDEDDGVLVTPAGLDSRSAFAEQQKQFFEMMDGLETEDTDYDRVVTQDPSFVAPIVSTPPQRPNSLMDNESTSSDSDQRESESQRKKLLQLPIRVYVQVDITTSEDDDITAFNALTHCVISSPYHESAERASDSFSILSSASVASTTDIPYSILASPITGIDSPSSS